jgi:hypothetical protein
LPRDLICLFRGSWASLGEIRLREVFYSSDILLCRPSIACNDLMFSGKILDVQELVLQIQFSSCEWFFGRHFSFSLFSLLMDGGASSMLEL